MHGTVTRVKDFWLKKYEALGRGDTLIFCSDYDVPTIFRNLQTMYSVSREHGPLPKRYPLWSKGKLSVLWFGNHLFGKDSSNMPSGGVIISSVGVSPENQYPYLLIVNLL